MLRLGTFCFPFSTIASLALLGAVPAGAAVSRSLVPQPMSPKKHKKLLRLYGKFIEATGYQPHYGFSGGNGYSGGSVVISSASNSFGSITIAGAGTWMNGSIIGMSGGATLGGTLTVNNGFSSTGQLLGASSSLAVLPIPGSSSVFSDRTLSASDITSLLASFDNSSATTWIAGWSGENLTTSGNSELSRIRFVEGWENDLLFLNPDIAAASGFYRSSSGIYTAIPEPASAGLLGVTSLALIRRRRNLRGS